MQKEQRSLWGCPMGPSMAACSAVTNAFQECEEELDPIFATLSSQIMSVNIESSQLDFLIKKVTCLERILNDSICQAVCLVNSLGVLTQELS